MADADGATKFSDLEKVEAGLHGLNPKPVWQRLVFVVPHMCHICALMFTIWLLCSSSKDDCVTFRTTWQSPVDPELTWRKSL